MFFCLFRRCNWRRISSLNGVGLGMNCLRICFSQRFCGKGKARVPFKDYWAPGCRRNWALLVSSPNWQETICIYLLLVPYALMGVVLISYPYANMRRKEAQEPSCRITEMVRAACMLKHVESIYSPTWKHET